MIKKLTPILILIFFFGCTSKKNIVERPIEILKIKKNLEVIKHIVIIDSIKVQKVVNITKNVKPNNIIELKKDDSLIVVKVIGTDSLYKPDRKEKIILKAKQDEILGSKTLFNLDSVVINKEDAKGEIECEKCTIEAKNESISFSTYILIWLITILIIAIYFYHKKITNLKTK